MEIKEGKQTYNRKDERFESIADVNFENGYVLSVFKGRLSEYDILIKYLTPSKKRLRTPKHIHWVADLLMKRQGNKILTTKYLENIKESWENVAPLISTEFEGIKEMVERIMSMDYYSEYEELNNYGEYKIDFLTLAIEILMVQEKTNRRDAFMFGRIINKLLEDELDIFSTIGTAVYNGR